MSKFIDLSGKKFGRLTVVKRDLSKTVSYFLCKCECGNTKTIKAQHLREGKIKSCGCLRVRHKKARTKIYRTWFAILYRCENPKSQGYRNYGGRGIAVCKRWHMFDNFLADMGEPPTPEHSIDRIDNNGNYEPKNCRWALPKEQANNTRKNIKVQCNGVCHTISEWSAITGISHYILRKNFKEGVISRLLFRESK